MTDDPRAVLTRPAPGPDLVLRYGDGPDRVLDVHLPPGPASPRPVLVLLHGGFWRKSFDRVHTRPLAHALRSHGYVVATPEFTRSSANDPAWPRILEDIAIVRRDLAARLADAAPGRTAAAPPLVVGHSAGGHLALWWAVTASAAETPRRVVALAPAADLARAYAEDLDAGAVRDLLGGGPEQYPERYAAADVAPRLASYRAGADLVVLHGDRDDRVPVEHGRALDGVRFCELAGADHFALIDPLSAAWPAVLAAVRGEH